MWNRNNQYHVLYNHGSLKMKKFISNTSWPKFSLNCLGDVMVHSITLHLQYIGVQTMQEKLPRKFNFENLVFRIWGHSMHSGCFNLSVFSHAFFKNCFVEMKLLCIGLPIYWWSANSRPRRNCLFFWIFKTTNNWKLCPE